MEKLSGKKRGRDFVNSKWSAHVIAEECTCAANSEFMVVGLRHRLSAMGVFTHHCWIPPSAMAAIKSDVIYTVTTGLQTQHPDASGVEVSGEVLIHV